MAMPAPAPHTTISPSRERRPALTLVVSPVPIAGRRYLAWHFPYVSADRWRCTRPPWDAPDDAPVVFVEQVRSKGYVASADARGTAAGIADGMTLTAARAKAPGLVERPHRPRADLAWLERLADGARRWTDRVAIEPPQGLVLDVTGAGEAQVAAALSAWLARLGVTARSAAAAIPEAALALARWPVGAAVDEAAALRRLGLEAIGLDPAMLATRGVATLGDLRDRPRASLPRLVGRDAMLAIDRLFGAVTTGVRFSGDRPVARVERQGIAATRPRDLLALARAVVAAMPEGESATTVEFRAFRVDGLPTRQCVRLPGATRDPAAIVRALRAPAGAVALLRLDIIDAMPTAAALLF